MLIKIACNNCFKILSNSFIPAVSFFSSSSALKNAHTTKGWKLMAKTGLKKNDLSGVDDSPSCEEGTDAVFHSILINELQKCKTVPEQIETFSSLVSLTKEDIEKRKAFCNSLDQAFQPYFGKFRVHLFGSSINGLGFKGSDVDISLQTIFDNQEYLTDVREVPTLQSVITGSIPKETISRLPPRFLLRFVRRILRQDCEDIKEPILYIKGRCPILRFYNAKFDLFCDFSCENEASLRNTKLIKILCLLDKRFSLLTKFTRYWGKLGGFVGDIDQFNSYAFSLLVVHYLQQTDPPVLPPLKDIIEASDYLMKSDICDEEQMYQDVKLLKSSHNNQPVEELLKDFFFYFLNFDYSRIMVPLTSSLMPKRNFLPCVSDRSDTFVFSPVAVQDPFRLNFNTTATATFKNCRKFLNGIMEACKVYQNESLWDPNSDMWGLCSLLIRPMSEDSILQEWQANRTFALSLPLKSSDVVKRIFQDGLLFECNDFYDEEASLKFSCKVYNNTWQGRDWVRKTCPSSITDILQRENWISNKVLKSRDEFNKQVMFTFTCKCYERTVDNQLDIVLSFPESRCNPGIAVFLKDYVPSVYKKVVQ